MTNSGLKNPKMTISDLLKPHFGACREVSAGGWWCRAEARVCGGHICPTFDADDDGFALLGAERTSRPLDDVAASLGPTIPGPCDVVDVDVGSLGGPHFHGPTSAT